MLFPYWKSANLKKNLFLSHHTGYSFRKFEICFFGSGYIKFLFVLDGETTPDFYPGIIQNRKRSRFWRTIVIWSVEFFFLFSIAPSPCKKPVSPYIRQRCVNDFGHAASLMNEIRWFKEAEDSGEIRPLLARAFFTIFKGPLRPSSLSSLMPLFSCHAIFASRSSLLKALVTSALHLSPFLCLSLLCFRYFFFFF